jgi:protein SCO1/2
MYNPLMTDNKQTSLLIGIVAVISLVLGIGFNLLQQAPADPREQLPEMLWPQPRPIMPFKLFDHHGADLGVDQLKGHWSLMFFGFTHCPDVCPTTMMLLNKVVSTIEPQARVPSVYFISVDPERDVPSVLSDYVSYFNPDFIAATGEPAQLAYFARQLGVLYVRDEGVTENDYLLDHSASILLVDPQARIVGVFSTPHDASNIRQKYLAIREFVEAQDE